MKSYSLQLIYAISFKMRDYEMIYAINIINKNSICNLCINI